MRVLVIGAGAVGGYFGARLLEQGRDVTFLVRARRREQLMARGLSVRSPVGDIHIDAPPTVTADTLRAPFDLILLSCKAYDLEHAMADFAPAVGPQTMILPLLNGMRHLELLSERFGRDHVLGGVCVISATLDDDGQVVHLNEMHHLAFGEQDGSRSHRVEEVEQLVAGVRFDARLSTNILQEMWAKWVFITAAAGITCLMRASVGDIVAAGAMDLSIQLLDECTSIAAYRGFALPQGTLEQNRARLTTPGSLLTASMLRDVERGAPTEVDHIMGDLLRRGDPTRGYPLLQIANAHLNVYEARRKREGHG